MMLPVPGLAPFGPTISGMSTRRVPVPNGRTLRGLGATNADLAQAIARFEGSCSGGVCTNNNPGNLRTPGSGPWRGQTGVDSRGFAVFADPADGWAALDSQITYNENRGLTLSEFFGGKPGVYPGYAPAADKNNPGKYSSTVAAWLGIDNNTPLSQALDASGSGSPSSQVFGEKVEDGGGTTDPTDTTDAAMTTTTALALAGGAVALVWMLSR